MPPCRALPLSASTAVLMTARLKLKLKLEPSTSSAVPRSRRSATAECCRGDGSPL